MTDHSKQKTPDLASLIGQWRLVSFDMENQASGERKPVFGERPNGRLVLLPNSVIIVLMTAQDRPVPTNDAERAAAFKTMFSYSGPFELQGDRLVTRVDVAWNEAWNHKVQTRYVAWVGPRLSLTTEWAPSITDPNKITRGVLVWEREA